MTNSSLITPNIFHDLPLEPAWKDGKAFFRFEDYANTFARLIAAPGTRTPLVLGVSGKWGSGKTTLLKLLRSKLDETQWLNDLPKVSFINSNESASGFRRCRTVWFNAWKYANENSLLAALVRTILAEMARGDSKDKLKSLLLDPSFPRRDVLATFLHMFKFKLGETGFEPDIDSHKTETPFATHTAFFDHFSDAFDQLLAAWVHGTLNHEKIEPEKGALVILIDDLDRCLPPKTMQVLESVKLFLDKPGAVFVIGADEEVIRSAVEAHYQNQKITGLSAEHYLEKIFQLRFALPPLAVDHMGNYMTKIGLREDLSSSLDLIFAAAETNPRQIKTFVNYLEVSWAILKNSGQAVGINLDDFTRWLALTRVAPRFCDKVRNELKESRLKLITDAIQWAYSLEQVNIDELEPTFHNRFREYESNLPLRRVLKQITFSTNVTADVLEGLIFWSAPTLPKVVSGPLAKPVQSIVVSPNDWVRIPAGLFIMGSDLDNRWATSDEVPQHMFEIPYDYLIARTPVTNAEFREFVEAIKDRIIAQRAGRRRVARRRRANWLHPHGPQSNIEGLDDHPVVQVSWYHAQAYCEWLTDKMRKSGELKPNEIVRLPTEAEWEKAARGVQGYEWPWGNEWGDASKCNSHESGIGKTTPVGQFSPVGDSPYGVADMAGNVWEWCSSLYRPYPYRINSEYENLMDEGERSVRGGAFNIEDRLVRCAIRNSFDPGTRFSNRGFRVVRAPVISSSG